MLWKFFEDGLMTDIGTFNLSQSYVTDQSAGDNIIKLGKVRGWVKGCQW